jgi:transcriptional regulator with XRE-family HTH domain
MASEPGRADEIAVESKRSEPLDPDLVALGQAIKELRRERKLSLEKLAGKADLSANYLSDIERGTRNVGAKSIFAIARALSVHVSVLFNPPS